MKNLLKTHVFDHMLKSRTSLIRIVSCVLLLLMCTFSHAQSPDLQINLTLEYDNGNNAYAVYCQSNEELIDVRMIISQISIVTTASVSIADVNLLNTTFPTTNNWVIANNIQGPLADSAHLFVSFQNSGGYVDVPIDSSILLFEFQIDGGCKIGTRLFDNQDDPQLDAPGMNNISFVQSLNFISDGLFFSPYGRNVTGTSQIVFVNANATGTKDGDSWMNANPNLNNALMNLDCWKTEVWVAEGVYKPTNGSNRRFAFKLIKEISLYGGFLGIEEDRIERLGSFENTVLSGDIGQPNVAGDNAYNVVCVRNQRLRTTVIDGFVIESGQANHPTRNRHQRGGGIYILGSKCVVRNCLAQFNYCEKNGGGLYAYRSQVNIADIQALNNVAANYGGGVFVNQSSLELINATMENNEALIRGGGLYLNMSDAYIDKFECVSNDSENGGGAYLRQSTGYVTQGLLTSNSVGSTGNAMYLDQIYGLEISNCTMTNNISGSGQVTLVAENNSQVDLINSILWNDGDELSVNSSVVNVLFCNVFGGHTGTGVTDLDPEFVSQFDYNLSNTSPLIDKGVINLVTLDLDFDLNNNPRLVGLAVDLGAYENQTGGSQNRLKKPSEIAQVAVYPNPFVNYVTIRCDTEDFRQYIVVDNFGRQIMQDHVQSSEWQIDLSDLPQGLYHIVLIGTGTKLSRSVVKS